MKQTAGWPGVPVQRCLGGGGNLNDGPKKSSESVHCTFEGLLGMSSATSSEMYTLLLCVYYKSPRGRRCQRGPVVNDERVLGSVLK